MKLGEQESEHRFVEAVRHALESAAETGGDAFWLLDASALQMPWLTRYLHGQPTVDVLRSDAGTPSAATPLLTPVRMQGVEAVESWRALHRFARHACAVSLLASAMPLHDLRVALQARSRVKLVGGMNAVLRWFDTRVTPALARVLTSSQLATLTAGISQWHYLDRWGALQVLELPNPSVAKAEGIQLDQAQEDELVADGLIDAVIDHLLMQSNPALMDLEPPRQFELVAPLVSRALAEGANDPPAAATHVAAMLEVLP